MLHLEKPSARRVPISRDDLPHAPGECLGAGELRRFVALKHRDHLDNVLRVNPNFPKASLLAERVLQSEVPMFKGLEHTAIASPNPRALAEWYVQNLEFRINFEYDGNFFVRAQNGSLLEIIPAAGQRGPNNMKDPGIRHLAVMVEDFDAAYQRLHDRGVQFLTEPYVNQGNRLVFFSDGDGNILHLIHREKPLP